MFLVPEKWLKGLLEYVNKYDEENKNWKYGEHDSNSKIHIQAAVVIGYAKSAESILRFNESIESENK